MTSAKAVSGLGLSIVKILVGKHGGTVVAESHGLGKGSTLPLRFRFGPCRFLGHDTAPNARIGRPMA